MEQPDAQSYLLVNEVCKTHHREGQIEGEAFHTLEDGYALGQLDARDEMIVRVQAVQRSQDEWYGESQPHHRAAEERIDRTTRFLLAHHQGQLSERIGQTFVLDPLLAEEHR